MVTVAPDFLLMGALLYFFGGLSGLCACLSAACAHELGHLAALVILSCPVKGLRLSAEGFVIATRSPLSPGREAVVLLSGPLGGLLFAALCLGLNDRFFLYAGACALLSSFFNLLPVPPLDGGRLAQLLLFQLVGEVQTAKILTALGCVLSLSFLLCPFSPGVFAGMFLSVLVIQLCLR